MFYLINFVNVKQYIYIMSQNIQIGGIVGGNLKKETIEIEIDENFCLKGGRVAVIDISNISIVKLEQLKEFINNL